MASGIFLFLLNIWKTSLCIYGLGKRASIIEIPQLYGEGSSLPYRGLAKALSGMLVMVPLFAWVQTRSLVWVPPLLYQET